MPDTSGSPTLLAHLVPKFAHPENVAVDALGHIFARSASARDALSDLLRDGGAGVGPIATVQTQATGEGGEQPDLAVFDDRGGECGLIEAKFWAGLTDNQPVAYLERLRTDGTSALLFVAPEARRESLWAELRDRVQDANGLEWRPDEDALAPRAASVGGGRRLLLTSWRALLSRMASRTSDDSDTSAELDIRQLRGLADRMDNDAFLPLRSDELGPAIPRRVLNFNSLLDAAFAKAGSEGTMRTVSPVTSTSDRRGGRVRIAGARAWFGTAYDLWAKHRTTPFWVRFWEWKDDPDPVDLTFSEARRRLAPLTQGDPPELIVEGSDLFVPISLPTGVEEEAVVEAIVTRLAEIAALLADHGE